MKGLEREDQVMLLESGSDRLSSELSSPGFYTKADFFWRALSTLWFYCHFNYYWTLAIFACPVFVPFFYEVLSFLLGKSSAHFVSSFGEVDPVRHLPPWKMKVSHPFLCLPPTPMDQCDLKSANQILSPMTDSWASDSRMEGLVRAHLFWWWCAHQFLPQTLTKVLAA